MNRVRYNRSRGGFVETLLILIVVILILVVIGSSGSRSGGSSTVPQPRQFELDREARKQAITNRLEAVRKRRTEVAMMSDYAVKERMLKALDTEIDALERTLREEF